MANVLVVDDDETVRRAVHRMLASLGHEAFGVGDGADALALLEHVRFALVITDVSMAGGNGMELLVGIQRRDLEVPVVAISGSGYMPANEILAMARECGAAATLVKPFSREQLRDAIEPVLGNGRSLSQTP